MKQKIRRKPVGMMSLIDVVFLLLIFFLIISIFVNSEKKEYYVRVKTPKTGPGDANILIQILDDEEYLYLDSEYFSNLEVFLSEDAYADLWPEPEETTARSKAYKLFFAKLANGEAVFGPYEIELPNSLKILDKSGIKTKVGLTVQDLGESNEGQAMITTLLLLIRCPSSAPYGDALVVIDAINKATLGSEYIDYGISGGSISQFSNSDKGSIIPKDGEDGYAASMVIKFAQ